MTDDNDLSPQDAYQKYYSAVKTQFDQAVQGYAATKQAFDKGLETARRSYKRRGNTPNLEALYKNPLQKLMHIQRQLTITTGLPEYKKLSEELQLIQTICAQQKIASDKFFKNYANRVFITEDIYDGFETIQNTIQTIESLDLDNITLAPDE